jgi:hypothetical protein
MSDIQEFARNLSLYAAGMSLLCLGFIMVAQSI